MSLFGKRYDPSAVEAAAEPAANDTSGLDAIKARIARNQAKRQKLEHPASNDISIDAPEPDIPPKGVRFSDKVEEKAIEARPEISHEDPSETAAAPKAKTKAKQRYLKRKADRKKAAKKAAVLNGSQREDGSAVVQVDDADEDAIPETPEERFARKKALKEARKQKRAEAAALPNDISSGHSALLSTPDGPSQQTQLSLADIDMDTEPTPLVSVKPVQAAVPSEIEAVSAKDAKALKKAAKAAAKSAKLAAARSDSQAVAEPAAEPTHPNALPRFPRPAKLAEPDKDLIARLSISKELQGGLRIDPSTTVRVDDLIESTSKDGPRHLLSERAREKMADLGIEDFFAVQSLALPLLLNEKARFCRSASFQPRDLCFNAPTGSGKTLAYVVPIVELLSKRIVRRLRALVVLPTRDLVLQVKETFEMFAQGTDLKIGTATGQHSFAKEAAMLSGDLDQCGIDILVATPGRLCDHIEQGNPDLLKSLQFLVIDEADRLLDQSFNEWLPLVLGHLNEAQDPPENRNSFSSIRHLRAQKLLFSATLSRDPFQVSKLHLHSPLYVAVTAGSDDLLRDSADFSLPPTLKEHMIVCSAALKPLLLYHLVSKVNIDHALCFTKSIESATRLVKLFEFLNQQFASPTAEGEDTVDAQSFSSNLPVMERSRLLAAFQAGKIRLLVCSDLIARGMDIANVKHVINYDSPTDMRKYVHRVGRTARAGKEGQAWSLVETQEALYFKNMMRDLQRLKMIEQLKTKTLEKEVEELMPGYQVALDQLKDVFASSYT